MTLRRKFIFTHLLIIFLAACSDNKDDSPPELNLNPHVQTQEDRSASFTPVPITSDVFLSTLAQPAHGEIINAAFGQYVYVPPTNFNGQDTAAFTLSDGKQGTVTFNVNPVNDAPLAADDTGVSIGGATVTIPVLANDVDFDADDQLTINNLTQPELGSVKDNGDGSVEFTPPADFVGEVRFSYEVKDTASRVDSAEVSVFVISGEARLTSIELAPSSLTLTHGASVQFKAIGTFADGNSADITSISDWTTTPPTLLSIGNQQQNKGSAIAQGTGFVTVGASFDGITVSTTVTILSQPPEAPANLTGEYIGNNTIRLNWAETAGADHYNLYWYSENTGTQVISHVTPPFHHADRQQDTTFYYTVRGVNEDGLEGKPSEQAAVMVQSPPDMPDPTPPADITLNPAANQVQLSWQAADNADRYVVYWSNTLPVEPSSANRIEVTDTTFAHEALESGLDYHYVVASVSGGIESTFSEPFSTTLLPTAPELSALPNETSVVLSWNAVTGADTYWLYWSNTSPVERDSTQRFEINADDPLTIDHSGLTVGETYHYLLVAINEGGESQPALATARLQPARPPVNAQADFIFNEIRLSWDLVDNASYRVYWSNTTPVDTSVAEVVLVDDTEYRLGDLLPASHYYFVLTTVVNGVESNPTQEISISVPPETPLVSAIGGNQRVTLSWKSVDRADGYTIYWAENVSTESSAVNAINFSADPGLNKYVHDKLNNGSTYYYNVTANFDGAQSTGNEVRSIPRDYTVTKTTDSADGNCDTDCSLREAINAANNSPGEEAIFLPQGTYQISIVGAGEDAGLTGDLDLTDDFSLLGFDAASTIIDANGLDRVLDISASSGRISGITVRNGVILSNAYGGGIRHTSGELQIDNSIITGNRVRTNYGGGIANRGNEQCNFLGNDGGLNALGGICPSLTINHSAISNNCAPGSGSAIENFGLLTINNSTISSNGLIEDLCSDDYGVVHTQYGVAIINHSTLSDNTADSVFSEWIGTTIITNSTIANNLTRAGAVASGFGGKVALNNSTVSGNTSGLAGSGSFGAPVEMVNTIVAGNISVNNTNADCAAIGLIFDRTESFISLGSNLIENVTGCPTSFTLSNSDISGDSGLSNFTDNGFPGTGHFPLLADSQAIDFGNNQFCPEADQLGNSRPTDGDNDTVNNCDIGAFEFGATATNKVNLLPPVVNAVGNVGRITLMWNGVNGAVGYNIYWAENETVVPSPDRLIQIDQHGATNIYVHEPLKDNTTYHYLIKAVSEDKTESKAREVNTTTLSPG